MTIMSIDEWFNQILSSDYPIEREEVHAVREFLADRISVDTAAQRFTAVVARNKDDLEDGLDRIWAFIIDIAKKFPDAQDKLVQLLKRIKGLPDLEADGEVIKVYGTLKVWSDLPLFGYKMRDCWNYFDPPPSDPKQDSARCEWREINAFAARITAHDIDLEFTGFGLWSFRDALENEPWNISSSTEPKGREREIQLHEHSIQVLDGLVPAAAQWILHAGPVIFACQDEIQPGPQKGDPYRGGVLWDGKHGFCKERWELWRKRLEWVQERPELAVETKKAAHDAVEAMSKVESNG